MSTKTVVDGLWSEMRQIINETYKQADELRDDDGMCLRDYAENTGWSDDLDRLLEHEKENERQHRRRRPNPPNFSVETASKLILLNNFAHGAEMTAMPKATAFIVLRQTAVEAELLGYLCRKLTSADFRNHVRALDYAKLMQVAQSDAIGATPF